MMRVAALLAVALLAWAAAASAESGPLSLELRSSRDLCTAGTLTEVSWEISGGAPPYSLTISGVSVDPNQTSIRVECGMRLDGRLEWLWGIDQRTRVQGTVTDANGATAAATAVIVLAYPLPPPLGFVSDYGELAAGLQSGLHRTNGSSPSRDREASLYLVRWRELGSEEWAYEQHASDALTLYSWRRESPRPGATYELQFAELRDQIEAASPAALRWSAARSVLTTAPASEVTAKVTHDTVTLSRQSNVPSARASINVSPALKLDQVTKTAGGFTLITDNYTGLIRDEVFDGLEPNTEYSIRLWNSSRLTADASFDIRTSPAPAGWTQQVRTPRNVRASVGSGVRSTILYVEWDPPIERTEHEGWASACEWGARGEGCLQDTWREGTRRVARRGVQPGKTYVVTVRYFKSLRTDYAELLVQIPPLDDETWIDFQSLPDVEVSWTPTPRLREDPQRGFEVSWSSGYRYELAEVEWSDLTHVRSVQGVAPIRIAPTEPGEYAFRVRFRRNGLWTKWTQRIVAATTPRPPPRLEISNRIEGLRISWDDYEAFAPIDGYRVYVSRESGPEQVFDVRGAHSTLAPAPQGAADYQIRVAAYNDRFGEGTATEPERFSRGEALSLWISSAGTCDPHSGLPALIGWTVKGGAAPYSVQASDQAPIQTMARSGSVTTHCEQNGETDGQRREQVRLTVTDAFGESASVEHTVRRLEAPPDGMVRTIDIEEIGPYSVHRTEVRLSWSCQAWSVFSPAEFPPATFILRWRRSAEGSWTYHEATASVSEVDLRCRWVWIGLQPGTEYQFQVAARRTADELQTPEQLRWTPVSTVVTLNDPAVVETEYSDGNVTVAWRGQPDAWAYVVVLRGEDVSWWRFHRATDNAEERAIFRDLPHDGPYEVEVTTPPRVHGEDAPKPGWMPVIRYSR